MTYFKPKSFLLSLRNSLTGTFTMEKTSTDKEPLRYKISGSQKDFAFLFFETVEGMVRVALDFGAEADAKFVTDLSKIVETVLKSGYGDDL
jgi:hypothetical protein